MDALMREVPSCSAMVRPLANPHIYLTAVPIKTVREMDAWIPGPFRPAHADPRLTHRGPLAEVKQGGRADRRGLRRAP